MTHQNLPPVFDLPYTPEEFTMWLLQEHNNKQSLLRQEIYYRTSDCARINSLCKHIERRYKKWTTCIARRFPHLYTQKETSQRSAMLDSRGDIVLCTQHVREIWIAGVFIRDYNYTDEKNVLQESFVNGFT
tara:strand:- start:640 stop:1032 length:393 start_codon:yes stop_codon:yes gene_type:complete